jgi:hypothetical protein
MVPTMTDNATRAPVAGVWYDHQTLMRDVTMLQLVYDQAAQGVLDLANKEGYFEGINPDLLQWPPGQTPEGPIGLEGLAYRSKLIGAIYEGVPSLRDQRLSNAFVQFEEAGPAYHEATQIYAAIHRQFLDHAAKSSHDFLTYYQTIYVDVLRASDLFTPDEGEAAVAGARLSRLPLSHAQPVAEKLKATIDDDDAQWEIIYEYNTGGEPRQGTLRDIFRNIAKKTLDYLATGELIAVHYNTYTNLAWFGSAVWRILSEAEYLLEVYRKLVADNVIQHQLDGLKDHVMLGQSMMVEFFQAHQENPGNLKPTGYWYGHHYTALTRDMIDLAMNVIEQSNRLIQQFEQKTGDISSLDPMMQTMIETILPMQVPELFSRTAKGRFLEYPNVGKNDQYTGIQRAYKLTRWIGTSWRFVRHKQVIEEEDLSVEEKLDAAWDNSLNWANKTLRIFGIEVKIKIDPLFKSMAQALDLASGRYKILFFPTHQSVFDHPVMYHVLQTPELLDAMGWDDTRPCTILSRSGLTEYVELRLGSWNTTMFGVKAVEFDRLLEDVDGYVVLPRAGDTNNATQRFANILEDRPGVIYAAGTTAAFDIQSIHLQHGLFSKIPSDVVIIPMAFRGIHSIWPKCPKRNIRINPGLVEVVVAPPMLGETTLFPKRRLLRPQIEPAALFHAVQIVNLLNPEYRDD